MQSLQSNQGSLLVTLRLPLPVWASCDTCLRSAATAAARSVSEMPAASRSAAVLLKCMPSVCSAAPTNSRGEFVQATRPSSLGCSRSPQSSRACPPRLCQHYHESVLSTHSTSERRRESITWAVSDALVQTLAAHSSMLLLMYARFYCMGECFRQAVFIADDALNRSLHCVAKDAGKMRPHIWQRPAQAGCAKQSASYTEHGIVQTGAELRMHTSAGHLCDMQ